MVSKAEETVTEVAASAELNELRAEVARLKAAQPKFVRAAPVRPARQRTYEPPERLRQLATKRLAKGETVGGQTRWLDTPQGRESLPPAYRPIFYPDDMVQLNPEAPIWGGDGKIWGDILNNPEVKSTGIGTVVGTMYSTETFEPKYKVQIPGLTHGSGDGFRESELLPYDG